jgi:hypothetical protein
VSLPEPSRKTPPRKARGKHKVDEPAQPKRVPAAPVIDPRAVYDAPTFRQVFGLTRSSLAREVRERRLRVAKRCGRYFLLGDWILDWLRNGELKPRNHNDN